jgi:hypothetical protein
MRTIAVMHDSIQRASAPRLCAIVATKAPLALVFRRGPSRWYHLLRWRLDNGTLEPGVWVRKRLYPERCDLSSDGQLLLYYLSGAFQGEYRVFGGISRAPWLSPLTFWEFGDTWSAGEFFVDNDNTHLLAAGREVSTPIGPVRLDSNDSGDFPNERRRGWTKSADSPPHHELAFWHSHSGIPYSPGIILERACPTAGHTLRLIHGPWPVCKDLSKRTLRYEVRLHTGECVALDAASWADWDHTGRLLVATKQGHLQACDLRNGVELSEDHDLSALTPAPGPPPEWAAVDTCKTRG